MNFTLRVQVCKRGCWEQARIKINNGRIGGITGEEAAARDEPQGSTIRDEADSIDLSNCYLAPGLVDCHVHFAMNGLNLQSAIDGWVDEDATRGRVAETLRQYLDAGVTHVRDGGDAAGIGLTARRMVEGDGVPGPRISACGHAIYKKGCYGDFLGPGIVDLDDGFRQISKASNQTSCIKVCQSGLVSFKNYGSVGAPQFTIDELTRLTGYAHDMGLSVMVHASGAEAIDVAVKAKVDTIEHGYYISLDSIKLMARRGTVWVPTLSPLANLLEKPHLLYTGASLEVVERLVNEQKRKVKLAYDEGVRIAVGTDAGAAGVAHGESIYDEIEHMVSTGLSREIVFDMAYREGRRVLGKPISGNNGLAYGWQAGDAFGAVIYTKDPFKNPVQAADIAAVCLPR